MNKLLIFIKNLLLKLRYCFLRDQIAITQAVLSGNGSFVDIRYWLSRPDKINPGTKIYLINQENGAHLEVMKLARIGPLKNNHAMLEQTGTVLFRNRHGQISSGSKVSLVLGSLKTDYIEVS